MFTWFHGGAASVSLAKLAVMSDEWQAMGSRKHKETTILFPSSSNFFVGRTRVLQRWLTGASRRRKESEGRHLSMETFEPTLNHIRTRYSSSRPLSENTPKHLPSLWHMLVTCAYSCQEPSDECASCQQKAKGSLQFLCKVEARAKLG